MTVQEKRARTQFQKDDVSDPERLRRVLNDFALEISTRLSAVEAAPGLQVIELSFDTGALVTYGSPPFTFDTCPKVSLPYTPTGVVLLSLQQTQPAGQPVQVLPCDVKWHFGAGSGSGDGVLHIDYVTGLSGNRRYLMRLGVTRG